MRRVLLLILSTALMPIAPAIAQDGNIDGRVKRLEKEMRAVQRKVFPGGSGRFFEPDIQAGPAKKPQLGPSSTPVSDLISRVDALEAQLANLTGQVEQVEFVQRKMEGRLVKLEAAANAAEQAEVTPIAITSETTKPAEAKPAKPSEERLVGVASIVKPETGDSAEDSYIYGYRLWDAKYYPEAQTQLKDTVGKHETHRRASFAQNLLGRAYLDEGKPALASVAFYENYQKRPRGERAPDSLYFLGVALTQLKKQADACRVFGELADVYPEVAAGRLANRVTRGRAAAECQ